MGFETPMLRVASSLKLLGDCLFLRWSISSLFCIACRLPTPFVDIDAFLLREEGFRTPHVSAVWVCVEHALISDILV